jgi:hypothetical protein
VANSIQPAKDLTGPVPLSIHVRLLKNRTVDSCFLVRFFACKAVTRAVALPELAPALFFGQRFALRASGKAIRERLQEGGAHVDFPTF